MGRQSHTKEWFVHSNITVWLKESDIVERMLSDKNGNIQTQKRAYDGLKATVLESNGINENRIESVKGMRIWACEINSRGGISTVGIPEKEFTVIIHLSENYK